MPVALRPPCVKISQRGGSPGFDMRLASTATTTHWSPNFSAASLTKARLLTAAVLIETLSAPEASSTRMSSMVRTPPPTVSGMKQASAVRCTTSSMMPRFSWLAVMSRKVSSSAPASSKAMAAATGSPASRRLTKLTPLTTRPSFTSRQGMTRTLNIALLRFLPPAPPPNERDDAGNHQPDREKRRGQRDCHESEIADEDHDRECVGEIGPHEQAGRSARDRQRAAQGVGYAATDEERDERRRNEERDQHES